MSALSLTARLPAVFLASSRRSGPRRPSLLPACPPRSAASRPAQAPRLLASRSLQRTAAAAAGSAGGASEGGDGGDAAEKDAAGEEEEEEEEAKGFKGWWKKNSLDKKKLASLGTSVLLSYGFVSNVNAITLMLIAFVTFGKSQMVSPLAAGMWPKFLAVYAALYATFGNLLRPVRVGISISISPFFDKVVDWLQERFKVKKPVAFGMVVFVVNICGSWAYLLGGAFVVSLVFGVPLFP